MPRRLSDIAKDCKEMCGTTIVHLGRLQDLDGARNPAAVLDRILEVEAALRQISREMNILAARYQAIVSRKAEP